METRTAHIPYGGYWSTPFVKWQGRFSELHAIEFAGHTARRELDRRSVDISTIDLGILGTTVPQRQAFYGVPWLFGLIGAPNVTGPTISQACATSAACLEVASRAVSDKSADTVLLVAADRISNGPHIYYPSPGSAGGSGQSEDWVLGNIARDPYAETSMLQTAENVAREYGISASEQHDLVLRRYAQYSEGGTAFRRRFMTLPFDVPNRDFTKIAATIDDDEGVFASTAEGLARLKPAMSGGTVTFGSQTHPADGNAGMIVTTADRARMQSSRPEISIEIKAFGAARVERAHMPKAPVPAARRALDRAGLEIRDMAAVKSHNPFAVNDIVFARETGADLATMNNNGCSLIWGHPQAPTGLRAMIEMIEELVVRGGGHGLFQGCAAGDTAMAVILKVSDDSET